METVVFSDEIRTEELRGLLNDLLETTTQMKLLTHKLNIDWLK